MTPPKIKRMDAYKPDWTAWEYLHFMCITLGIYHSSLYAKYGEQLKPEPRVINLKPHN